MFRGRTKSKLVRLVTYFRTRLGVAGAERFLSLLVKMVFRGRRGGSFSLQERRSERCRLRRRPLSQRGVLERPRGRVRGSFSSSLWTINRASDRFSHFCPT